MSILSYLCPAALVCCTYQVWRHYSFDLDCPALRGFTPFRSGASLEPTVGAARQVQQLHEEMSKRPHTFDTEALREESSAAAGSDLSSVRGISSGSMS